MPKRRISRFLYYIIISSITEIVLLVLAGISLVPTGILREQAALYLAGYIFYYVLKTALLISFLSHWTTPELLTRIAGMLPGRIIGLFTGVLLGYQLGGILIAAVEGVLLYLFFRWLGGYISIKISQVLAEKFELPPMQETAASVVTNSTMRWIFFGYLLLTVSFVVIIGLFEWLEIRYIAFPKILPFFRIYAPVASIVMVALAWYQKNRISLGQDSAQGFVVLNARFTIFLLGMSFSFLPTIMGFVLYFIGAHFFEALLYVLFSLIWMSLWAVQEFKPTREV